MTPQKAKNKALRRAAMIVKGYAFTKQAVKEGKAIERLSELRPSKIGASHNSMIYNTASRIGQLEDIRHARVLVLLDDKKL